MPVEFHWGDPAEKLCTEGSNWDACAPETGPFLSVLRCPVTGYPSTKTAMNRATELAERLKRPSPSGKPAFKLDFVPLAFGDAKKLLVIASMTSSSILRKKTDHRQI
ncbi:hypothetical protein T265_02986 [Opisthorchis viverrini]|uniref:Uncharacterized protein n=1 Tax=Opisthorchis viverrini TaxID=6198 RepID=A0A074ZU62_OPIVI|nr:hypothetical protein T265_02986 [Opisthorchis viverrini]KER30636.1 hypothetical protein T265_02986 [Opisthorchis viverrini]